MRRVLVLAAMAALVIGSIPTIASAARAERFSDEGLILGCFIGSAEEGVVYMVSQVSGEYGGYAGLYWWGPGVRPFENPPTLISGENAVTATVDGNTMDATMELYVYVEPDPSDPEGNPYGDPAGQATLSATFEAAGEPIHSSYRSQGSNAKTRIDTVQQQLTAAGSLVLPDASYDLSECQAAREQISYFATNPDTRIERFEGIGMSCEWTDADRQVLLFANTDHSDFTYSELLVSDASGKYFSSGDASLTERGFSGTWQLRAMGSEGEIAPAAVGGELFGSATASASLSPTGEGERVVERSHGQMIKFSYEVLAVSGELTVTTQLGTTTLAMDAEHCTANTTSVHARFSSPNGTGGRPLPNDLPQDAEPIDIGESVSVRSAGTDAEPEAPCRVFIEELGEEVDVPIGHTGWWSFTGTGGEVTVDTAGSDFDTVVGVYVQQDGEMVQVGCIDDVFGGEEYTLQAAITVGTDADATYYAQAGGYGGSTGQLELSVH